MRVRVLERGFLLQLHSLLNMTWLSALWYLMVYLCKSRESRQ